MKKRKLGASALEVSGVCLGTMTWGEQNTEADAHAQIALAFAKNRFFTASTIVGATSIGQLEELSGYFDFVLSPEILSGVEEINTLYPSPCAQ